MGMTTVTGFAPETEQRGCLPLYAHMYTGVGRGEKVRKIHCKELAHKIMGAERTQDLPAGDPGEPMALVPVWI